MPSKIIHIPAIGEGLQEARIVSYLKQPGETVERDEPLYEMETDKAVMSVESPVGGTVEEWLVEEGAVVPIGSEVVRIDTEDEVEAAPRAAEPVAEKAAVAVAPGAKAEAARRPDNLSIPPRTRAYAKEKGLSEDDLAAIPAKGKKLTPEDIDAFLADGAKQPAPAQDGAFVEEPLPKRQGTLNYRMRRGADLVIPGTIERVVDWSGIEAVREAFRARGGDFQPSQYTIFAYGVAQAAADHPRLRSTLPNENTLRTYRHFNLGTAVAREGDELLTAVVENADTLDFPAFARRMREAIEAARDGRDQASESTQLTITNMAAFGLRSAAPVLVSPANSVLFMGETYDLAMPVERGYGVRFQRTVNLALTFDHRILNGVGAANFLNDVVARTENAYFLLKPSLP